ncbi:hypothetical protein [Pedobacter steynii]|uniref:Uncharacterized protein n=1 Tax=Pedobacter steynii TaxID=430522 RepID=A0A1D7QCG9_9SPHI|nr:hypothetical protein [Pedobacter steynii]AOM76249.1 hypothetical protein BFS30_03185 [Pedobacter steynii]
MEIKLNGNIDLDGFTITSKTKITDLPKYFNNENVTRVQVLDEMKSVQFSATEIELNGNTVQLSLRFEEDVLVSIFITVKELDNQYKTADDFYSGSEKRHSQYKKWLKSHISFKLSDFAGGEIGSGEDKSGNVFIYLHNGNNK